MSTVKVVTSMGVMGVVGLLVGYAWYFDQKRRKDPMYREKVKERRRKAREQNLQQQQQQQQERKVGFSTMNEHASISLQSAAWDDLDTLLKESIQSATSMEHLQERVMHHIQMGDTFMRAGPDAFAMAAKHFYVALKLAPNPVELLMVYEQAAPPAIVAMLMERMKLDMTRQQTNSMIPSSTTAIDISEEVM